MKLGLNGSTTDQCTLEEDIAVADQAGFDVLELRTYKISTYLEKHSLKELNNLFSRTNIEPYAINAIEFFNLKTRKGKENILKETEYWCYVANAINCPYVIAVPSQNQNGAGEEEIFADTVQMLEEMADIANRFHVNLAFEFIGFKEFSVRTLSVANQIVQEVNRENIGLVIDTYHFYNGGSSLKSIEKVDKNKLFIFHINDAEDVSKEERTEAHRIFPGLGVIPLTDICKALKEIGYDHMVSLELFRPDYWEMGKQHLANDSYRYVKHAIEKVF
ncbi:2-keto-myo-inositol isomerase [Geomicrobium halophilum]|uniref:2-keto-myo-inositol isomerase n=1 Tax=Geomicrobium halophilum TaxID=549000 RepID=A0A841PXD1_9BACL|nr:sugar phosphate isomerase/epimerase [Geomicrobium halophilum]MBB6448762.1 2-keto-myo-inositol isomerase [Geomicrobium halophilum]